MHDAISRRCSGAMQQMLEGIEEVLARRLGQGLGLGRPVTLLDLRDPELRSRVRVAEVTGGARWYYVDGACAFGIGAPSVQVDMDLDGPGGRAVFSWSLLDPADAPPYPEG